MRREDPLVRSLREGPPDEDQYVPADLGLPTDGRDHHMPHSRGRVLDSLRPRVAWRSPDADAGLVSRGRRLEWLPRAMALVVLVVLVAGGSFVAGRASVPGSPPTGTSMPSLLAPASVPDQLQRAFDQINQGPEPTQWVVCETAPAYRCSSAPPHQLSLAVWGTNQGPGSPAQGFAAPRSFWNDLPELTVTGSRVLAATDLHPQSLIDARLFDVDTWNGAPSTLSGVSTDPGTWFFDLGHLAPGRYVLAAEIDSSYGLQVVGVGVRVENSSGS